MKVLTVGGGSGGHVTPVVAVLEELKNTQNDLEVQFWCDKYFAPQAKKIIEDFDPEIPVRTVIAGKFRRYNHLTTLQHLTIPSVVFPNIRDAFYVLGGFIQTFVRLIIWRPDVVFAKGGYVCLPVGWAARVLRIPLVIHDSDAHPGLTNRLLAPAATRIATGVPLEHYDYPVQKSAYVGTPISAAYKKVSPEKRRVLKQQLGFDPRRPLVVFVGGGQGAKQINDAVALHLDDLMKRANIYLIAGTAQYDELRSLTPIDDERFVLKDFVSSGMPDILGAADVVVSRAGATFLLELAALGQPTILVPSKRLLWQVKHAKLFADQKAALLLDEDKFENPDDNSLVRAITVVLTDEKLRTKLANNLHKMARPHAARDVALMIVRVGRKRRR